MIAYFATVGLLLCFSCCSRVLTFVLYLVVSMAVVPSSPLWGGALVGPSQGGLWDNGPPIIVNPPFPQTSLKPVDCTLQTVQSRRPVSRCIIYIVPGHGYQ